MLGIKRIRLSGYTYTTDGYYFVTIVTRFRHRFFEYSEKRDQCESIFRTVANTNAGVTIDTFVIMPDHVHMIIVLERAENTLGEIVRRMKARSSYEFQERLWQPNYYEHVIRTDQALENIRAYIVNNPNKEPAFSQREMKNGHIYLP